MDGYFGAPTKTSAESAKNSSEKSKHVTILSTHLSSLKPPTLLPPYSIRSITPWLKRATSRRSCRHSRAPWDIRRRTRPPSPTQGHRDRRCTGRDQSPSPGGLVVLKQTTTERTRGRGPCGLVTDLLMVDLMGLHGRPVRSSVPCRFI